MSRKLALITILSLLASHTTTAAKVDVVAIALHGIGEGPVAEMKRRIFSLPYSICGSEDYRHAISSLPSSIRASRVSEGKLLRRVESRHHLLDQFGIDVGHVAEKNHRAIAIFRHGGKAAFQ